MAEARNARVQSMVRAPRSMRAAAVITAAFALLTIGPSSGHAQPTARGTASAAQRAEATLTCALQTPRGGRITFSPPVSTRPRSVSAQGTVQLNSCTSPNGRQPRIKSGKLTLRGSGTATCSRMNGVRGSATVTWYAGSNRTGRVIGRSVIAPAAGSGGYSPLDRFLSGRVSSGLMAARSVSGSMVPTNDARKCFGGGLDHVQGRGRLTVS
ncbi:hypothetical protein ACIRNI_20765 [Streptomyces sp. NPDC093546]|uniref:hypothetical protein n=1 Tax=Streptomyces sp. NPDC093546 TaxID=3366040 RepID=UPI0038111717